jgi:hypothetical protein
MSEANYCVIRYMPDPGRGENLNIGILLWERESAEYRLGFDQKAIERVVKWNPHVDRDSLRYIEPMLNQRLGSAVAPATARIDEVVEHGGGFPLNFTEPRFTTVTEDEDGLDATLARLLSRVVTPRQRYAPHATSPVDQIEKMLRPLLKARKVSRDHVFAETKTGFPRSADFFANSGANVALDVVKLAYKEADRTRLRADAEAFKVSDVLGGAASVKKYVVLGQFRSDREFRRTNDEVRTIIEGQGAAVLTDMAEAAGVLEDAARTA